MAIGIKYTWIPNNWLAVVADVAQAVTFDLERGLPVLITPSLLAGGSTDRRYWRGVGRGMARGM